MNYIVNILDDNIILDNVDSTNKEIKKKQYVVIKNIFKNGKQYIPGDIILLDHKTAINFIKEGDIKNEEK